MSELCMHYISACSIDRGEGRTTFIEFTVNTDIVLGPYQSFYLVSTATIWIIIPALQMKIPKFRLEGTC